jgi:dTDP-D-glucose 4,6-dehydratase
VTDRPAHDRRYALDWRKLTRELGWTPRIRFADGLAGTVQWYLGNEDWAREVTQGRYDLGRLGLAGEPTTTEATIAGAKVLEQRLDKCPSA